MKPLTSCPDVQPHLAAWLDDELVGTARQAIARHLEECDDCSSRVGEMAALGDLLRDHAPAEPDVLAGLAGSVVTRLGAEERASWRGLVSRALDGWHWAIVGAGSLVATFANTSLLVAILSFGPGPTNQDSLSAVMTNLSTPAGYVFAFVSPEGQEQATAMWQYKNGLPVAPRFVAALAAPAEPSVSEATLVQRLADTVAPVGQLKPLASLSRSQRAAAEALLDEITRLRVETRAMTDTRRAFRVHSVRLVTSVTVKV